MQTDEVKTRDPLGDGVFDLESRVYFEEVEIAVRVQKELNSPGVGVVDGGGKGDGGIFKAFPDLWGDGNGGGFLDYFLEPALH